MRPWRVQPSIDRTSAASTSGAGAAPPSSAAVPAHHLASDTAQSLGADGGPLAWQGSTLVAEVRAETITALKERHDEVHVIGSLELVQSLLRFVLVDRLNLWLYPLLLGSGKQVFADGTVPTALRLTESATPRRHAPARLRDGRRAHIRQPRHRRAGPTTPHRR
ncbi:MAG TPA: dihydrofolate reductase family protein [Jiangellaceae bacterium]|nr:dihydrofolate reductase family protein [Jiangellaceae bacterium]